MITNSTHPYGRDSSDINELELLKTGKFSLNGGGLKNINQNIFTIEEFRYYCYKPSHGRTIHLRISKDKACGRRLVENLVGVRDEFQYTDCLDAFEVLPDDNSEFNGSAEILIMVSNLEGRALKNPFRYLQFRYSVPISKCDDNEEGPGRWQIYIR